jgi:hypothetical protein
MDRSQHNGSQYEENATFDPAAAFALRHDLSAFSVTSRRNSTADEQELIVACAEARRPSPLRKFSKKEKVELADRVMEDSESFVARLGAVLAQGRGLPTVSIEYRDLTVQADALVGADRTPSVWNSAKSLLRGVACVKTPTQPKTVLDGMSGVILPGRLTLLLGPPGGGKSVLLQALSGRLRPHSGLRISGEVKYNGVMPVMGFVFATKRVFYKHRASNWIPAPAYALALALTQVPTSLLESTIYSIIVYWVRTDEGHARACGAAAARARGRARSPPPSPPP